MVELNVDALKSWVKNVSEAYHPDLELFLIDPETYEVIRNAFFAGLLNDVVKFTTDRKKNITIAMAGIRVRKDSRVGQNRPLLLLNGGLESFQKPNGPNPVFPGTGPGGPHNDGTPMAMAA